jgi:diketogulonate reductase-like aldo/keto reductase
METVPRIKLNDGIDIPQVGFGVFLVPPAETKEAVTAALDVGYRHIDTARLYDNEEAVGQAIAESGIPREELFVTTKCWNDDQGFDRAQAAFDGSLERLGLDYVDLYLIHWPAPKQNLYVETWKAFEVIQAGGRSRSIGVSNFQPAHLQRLIDQTETIPAINQIELHPWLQQRRLREYHEAHGIVTEAWSPLARGGEHLSDPRVRAIAERHNVTAAQVILRWHLDIGNVIIPKSVNPSRIAANLDLFRIRLDEEDHTAFADLDSGGRIGPDPDRFG